MDPITIGLAFTAAQTAVGQIKQAIALGKDISGLVGQFSTFFDSADSIHRARTKDKLKASKLGKTDAELGREALQIAIHSDTLRESERELKNLIIWKLGKPEVWEQMIKERTRLFKERAEAERAEQKRILEHKKKVAEQCMFAMYFIAGSMLIFAFVMIGVKIYGAMEERKAYEKKVMERNLVLKRQAKEREEAEKKALEKYIKG